MYGGWVRHRYRYALLVCGILIVLAGFWYVWQKGVLDWNKQGRAEKI